MAARLAGVQRNNLRDFRNKNITVNNQNSLYFQQSMLARAFACKFYFFPFLTSSSVNIFLKTSSN
jgi:hypothetical protein